MHKIPRNQQISALHSVGGRMQLHEYQLLPNDQCPLPSDRIIEGPAFQARMCGLKKITFHVLWL